MRKMKNILMLTVLTLPLIAFTGCTKQSRARFLGGKMTIQLPINKKLIMCTWKDDDIFYLLEDMEESYVPKNKYFFETSAYGVMQTEITFIENKK